ncbi:junctional adhesion molecule-like isoform X1 [Haliaeetus albicilla]|uniref:junctional adhesion molecule-like isoform X1 n=2 Tax=Haliaeetus albicilla TaxID=8969 RepID=UPI0037E7012B
MGFGSQTQRAGVVLPYFPSAWLVQQAQQPLVWRLGGCAAPHPRHTKSRGWGEALPAQGAGPPRCTPDWSVPLAPGLSGEEISMGTGRLHLAVLPGLILLSLSLAEQCSGLAGWVFTEPQLRASTGDSVLLQCLFLDPVAKGWMMTKVDWLRVAGAGMQKEEMVFYYYNNHSIPVGRFRDRAQWQGDPSLWDGSIQLQDVQVNDSGTYVCEIRLLQHSSIFKNHTVLHVSPTGQRAGRGAAGTQDSAAPGDSGFWPVTVGCGCVAVVLAFLAGLSLRKRSAANTALERTGNGGSSKSKAEEALYSSIPGPEIPKAEQDAGKKRKAEETYITMHPSHFRENGIYVELAKRVIPAEWMAEGRQGDGQNEEPYGRPEAALPWAPEG